MDDQNSNQGDVQVQDAPVTKVDDSQNTAQSQPAISGKVDEIKRRALEALIPTIDSLEAGPERKYEILMTTLRSSFSEDLLEKALDAALKIEEPEAKAEALVDIVNETDFQKSGERT